MRSERKRLDEFVGRVFEGPALRTLQSDVKFLMLQEHNAAERLTSKQIEVLWLKTALKAIMRLDPARTTVSSAIIAARDALQATKD